MLIDIIIRLYNCYYYCKGIVGGDYFLFYLSVKRVLEILAYEMEVDKQSFSTICIITIKK